MRSNLDAAEATRRPQNTTNSPSVPAPRYVDPTQMALKQIGIIGAVAFVEFHGKTGGGDGLGPAGGM